MISLLQTIVELFVCWVKAGAVSAANFLIAGLGLAIEGLLTILPPMPELPEVPDIVTTGFAYAKYWFPVDFFLTLLALGLTLWAAWFIVSIPLRWAKASNTDNG